MIRTFTPDFFAKHGSEGSASERPIFIVGMPRSGTTLVEQIISSHPEIAAGGELAFWHEQGGQPGLVGGGHFDAGRAKGIAEEFGALIREVDPAASRVTDKLPDNYLRLGLIHWVFPKVRIIHCRRNPIDNGLSIYMTPFRHSLNFAHDREKIASVFREYRRLMSHWRELLPSNRFLEVDYESLVADRETTTKAMIEFCGLNWSEACLSHESNPRSVATPSMWQVRQPIYKTSVERWRNYEPWLGALASLGDETLRK